MMKCFRFLGLMLLSSLFPVNLYALDLVDVCQAFPNPVQGWNGYNSTLRINQRKSVSDPHYDYYISGWSDSYVASELIPCNGDTACGTASNKLQVPFDTVLDYSEFTSCEVGLCSAGATDKKGTQPTVTEYNFSSVTKSLTINDFENVNCEGFCNVTIDDVRKQVTLTVTGNFRNLITNHGYSNYEVIVKFTPGYVVKDFTANVATTLDFTESGKYLHHKLSALYSGSKVLFGSDVQLEIVRDVANPSNRGFVHIGENVAIESQSTEFDSLWINAPEGDIWVQNRITPLHLYAMLSARYITFDSQVYIYGAMSAQDITLNSQFSAIIGQSACFSDPVPAPVAKYHLEESWSGNSGEVKDTSGNNHNGRAINGAKSAIDLPAWPNDENSFGTCGYANFSRVNDQYVEVDHSASLSMSEEVSVSAWVYPKSYPSSDLASIVSKDSNYQLHLTPSGYIYWYWKVDSPGHPAYNLYSASPVPLNQWSHVTVTYNSNRPTQAKMYINGHLSSYYYVPLLTPTLLMNNQALQIGQYGTNRGFDGFIDEVQLFSSALSAAQVLEVYKERHLCQDQSQNLALRITPVSATGLACDGIPIDFSLIDADTGNIVEGDGQSLFVETTPLAGRDYACWSSNGEISSDQCTINHDYNAQFPTGSPATVRGYIHSKFLNNYDITASVNSESLTATAGPYTFLAQEASIVPSDGVDGNDFYQVAGREFPFRIKIRGAQGQGNQLNCRVIDVTGSVVVDFSTSQQPSNSAHGLQIKYGNSVWRDANTQFPITFTNGVAGGNESSADGTLKLRLDDAGIVDLTGTGNNGVQSLTSTERFYFRPFATTFCGQNGPLPNGTDGSTEGLAPAGSNVYVYLKAFNWQSALDSNNDGVPNGAVKASNLCGGPTTDSYFTHNGYVAQPTVQQLAVVYPVGGNQGALFIDGLPAEGHSFEITSSDVNRSRALNWNEVGTLAVSASQQSYLSQAGFNIPAVASEIGRFYPASFSIERTDWQAPIGQGGIAYLGQAYANVDVEVVPYPLGSTTAVSNYHLFPSSLQAGFTLKQDDSVANKLKIADSILENTTWSAAGDGTSRWLLSDSDAVLARQYMPDDSGHSVVNGPFNTGGSGSVATQFGLNILAGGDPVSFDPASNVTEQNFATQPPARYGRMVLHSATSSSATSVEVPLKIEFWNGSEFEVNSDDSASELTTSSSYICKKTIWPVNTSSGSALSGAGSAPWTKVSGGESDVVRAEPDSSHTVREQVQFWMRLGSSRPDGVTTGCGNSLDQPWLQYDWRGLGDEDPSSVVTFGIFRGNDRVIFRGESGLIGQ